MPMPLLAPKAMTSDSSVTNDCAPGAPGAPDPALATVCIAYCLQWLIRGPIHHPQQPAGVLIETLGSQMRPAITPIPHNYLKPSHFQSRPWLRAPSGSSRGRQLGPRPAQATTTRQQETRVQEESQDLLYTGESFYDLLGVSPAADRREIKRAYLSIMKECHPDTCDFDEANDFCALMNEVYETLSDPARRATYDALTGFSDQSINPFSDTTQLRDQVFVDEFTCIGCRNCCNVCPSTFAIEEDYGRARVTRQGMDPAEKQQEAIDTCPVSCIHWVTSPQLSLLEAAMAKMERIAVWSMGMSSAGSNRDVFTEAEIAWQKRRAELRRRRAAATGTGSRQGWTGQEAGWGSWWNNVVSFEGASGASFYEDRNKRGQKDSSSSSSSSSSDEDYDGAPLSDKDARGIAALAARAARASRTWKICQDTANRLRNRPLQLTPTSSASSMDEVDVLM